MIGVWRFLVRCSLFAIHQSIFFPILIRNFQVLEKIGVYRIWVFWKRLVYSEFVGLGGGEAGGVRGFPRGEVRGGA